MVKSFISKAYLRLLNKVFSIIFAPMEFDNNGIEEQDGDAVEIYSRRAVWWFSFLASPIFGSVLLLLNLRAVGYKKAMNSLIAFTLFFEVIANAVILSFIKIYKIDIIAYEKLVLSGNQNISAYDPNVFIMGLMIIGFKIIGSFIFTRYFFKKYFPDDDYYPKSILTPLFLTIACSLFIRIPV